MGRKRPTIEDVAAAAGVSRGTVSRVLNGGHYVSPVALRAVDQAIRRTGYAVNQHARSLVTRRSGSVAFILSEPQECLATDPNISVVGESDSARRLSSRSTRGRQRPKCGLNGRKVRLMGFTLIQGE